MLDQKEKLMQENKDLQTCYLENKQQLDELKNHMKCLTKVKSLSFFFLCFMHSVSSSWK